jgi:hypothetical protein
LQATQSRLHRIAVLAQLFRATDAVWPDDVPVAAVLACGRVAPVFAGWELGVGDATLRRALARLPATPGMQGEGVGVERGRKEGWQERGGCLHCAAMLPWLLPTYRTHPRVPPVAPLYPASLHGGSGVQASA